MADPNIAMGRTESPATQSFHTVCIVKDYVRSRRQSTREAFVPLHHPPGHAQVDFGEAVVEVGGRREKVAFFCLILPHSNLWFVKAYPRETVDNRRRRAPCAGFGLSQDGHRTRCARARRMVVFKPSAKLKERINEMPGDAGEDA